MNLKSLFAVILALLLLSSCAFLQPSYDYLPVYENAENGAKMIVENQTYVSISQCVYGKVKKGKAIARDKDNDKYMSQIVYETKGYEKFCILKKRSSRFHGQS